jgi:hypothetical protein
MNEPNAVDLGQDKFAVNFDTLADTIRASAERTEPRRCANEECNAPLNASNVGEHCGPCRMAGWAEGYESSECATPGCRGPRLECRAICAKCFNAERVERSRRGKGKA